MHDVRLAELRRRMRVGTGAAVVVRNLLIPILLSHIRASALEPPPLPPELRDHPSLRALHRAYFTMFLGARIHCTSLAGRQCRLRVLMPS